MRSFLAILAFSALLGICSAEGSPFDYLMFTAIYPTAVCRADDDAVPDSCEIPSGTPAWTIHGLWPNYDNGSYPQFCKGDPRHFDEKLIAPIEESLRKFWPNLFPTKSITSFWKHEYDKHGTCAQSDEKLDSELKYFQGSMSVYQHFDFEKALRELPTDEPISRGQVMKALSDFTGGNKVQIHCLKDKKTGQSLLADVRICVDKNLNVISCHSDIGRRHSARKSNRIVKRNSHQQPLPSFQDCPEKFVYLSHSSSGSKPWDKLTSVFNFFG